MRAVHPDERASSPGWVRAGDDDRTRVATLLAEHYSQGRLDDAELDERSSRALTAVYLHELDVLLEDLPGGTSLGQPATRRSPPQAARAAPRPPMMPLLILSFLALVVVTRGAALWLLPLLWWVGGPARFNRRPAPRSGPRYVTGPAAWRTGSPCRRWPAPGT